MKVHRMPCLILVLLALLQSPVRAEPESRRAQLDVAEQLALDAQQLDSRAERLKARDEPDAAGKVHAKAVGAMTRAIDIWSRLDAPVLMGAGLKELARIQMSFGDADAAIAADQRLVDHWQAHGDVTEQGWAYVSLSGRLQLSSRKDEALASFDRTIAFAEAHQLIDVQLAALSRKESLLKLQGRTAEAEATAVLAEGALAKMSASMSRRPLEVLPAKIPEGWIDVPGAPMFAELRTENGSLRLALTNRSAKPIVGASLGCVSEQDGKLKLLRGLFGVWINDSTVRPEGYFDLTRSFASPRSWFTDRPMGCQPGRPGVVDVIYEDGTKWHLPG